MSEAKALMKASCKRDMQDGINPDDDHANLDKYLLRMSDNQWSHNDPLNGDEVEV